MKEHKYKAERTGGFASKLEAAVYNILYLREKGQEIKDIKTQVQVSLTDAGIIYKPDFSFTVCKTGALWFAEAKGFETPEWRIKRRLWMFYGPAPLEIWKGHHSRPTLDEIIIPKGDR